MLLSVLSGFLLSLAAPWLVRSRPGAAGWLLALFPLTLAFYYARRLTGVAGGEAVVESFPWVPSLGVGLTFYADGLGLLFAVLIAAVGALILIYSGTYLAQDPRVGQFFRLLLFFMASMLGLVLAGDLILLFIFWELTSISSFFLIGFHDRGKEARDAARQALVVTALGEQALLAGFILLGRAGESLQLDLLLTRGDQVAQSGLYLPILLLVAAGAFAKSAQMPLHFWLPNAMAAPTPVSAYLHSVTMVKAGVYLLARFSPVLGGSFSWQLLLIGCGGATMLTGALLALWQTDLKRLLAYSTINALGTLVFLLGIGSDLAVKAALVYLLAHALYKGALFLVAGAIDHAQGTRDLGRLHGLFRGMPLTAAAAVLAALSLAGFPPLFGYVGKETIYDALLHAPSGRGLLVLLAVAANLVLVALAGVIAIRPFFGRPKQKEVHPARPALSLGPVSLAVGGLLFGLFPAAADSFLLRPAATAVTGSPGEELQLWHGIDFRFSLGLLTLVLGASLYRFRHRFRHLLQPLIRFGGWGPERWYREGERGLDGIGRRLSPLLRGSLQSHLLLTLLATFGLVLAALAMHGRFVFPPSRLPFEVDGMAVAVLILASAVLAIRAPSRLEAVVALGGVGFGIALLYARYSAPDLAMTQFAVETVTVILFVLVLRRFPLYPGPPEGLARGRDLLVAAGAGGIITLLAAAALDAGGHSRLAPFFAGKTELEAHGRNMVNVILVDFRGFDTLGEITVLALAAVGIYALLRPHAGLRPEFESLIIATATRYLVPLLLVFSGYLLLRGHVLPGGGFTAGLVFAAAYAFYGLASGSQRVRRDLPFPPLLFIGGGLLLTLVNGAFPRLRGKPFLTGIWSDYALSDPWEIGLGTPLLFDVGISLVVAGSTLGIILIMWEAE